MKSEKKKDNLLFFILIGRKRLRDFKWRFLFITSLTGSVNLYFSIVLHPWIKSIIQPKKI